jgi:hypothetical protein
MTQEEPNLSFTTANDLRAKGPTQNQSPTPTAIDLSPRSIYPPQDKNPSQPHPKIPDPPPHCPHYDETPKLQLGDQVPHPVMILAAVSHQVGGQDLTNDPQQENSAFVKKKISFEEKTDEPAPNNAASSDEYPAAIPKEFDPPGSGLANHNIDEDVEDSQQAGKLAYEEEFGMKLKKKVLPIVGKDLADMQSPIVSLVSARDEPSDSVEGQKDHAYDSEETPVCTINEFGEAKSKPTHPCNRKLSTRPSQPKSKGPHSKTKPSTSLLLL